MRQRRLTAKAMLAVTAVTVWSCAESAITQPVPINNNMIGMNGASASDCDRGPCGESPVSIRALTNTGQPALQSYIGMPARWLVTGVSTVPTRRVLVRVDGLPPGLVATMNGSAPAVSVQGTPMSPLSGALNVTARDISRCMRLTGDSRCPDMNTPMPGFDTRQSVPYSIMPGGPMPGGMLGYPNQGGGSTMWSALAMGMINQIFSGSGVNNIGTIINGGGGTGGGSTITPPTTGGGGGGGGVAEELLRMVNSERSKNSASALTLSAELVSGCQRWADTMASERNMYHDPNLGFMAENVAAGQRDTTQVMEAWMNSTGHRNNILSPDKTKFGAARSGNYWCQRFQR